MNKPLFDPKSLDDSMSGVVNLVFQIACGDYVGNVAHYDELDFKERDFLKRVVSRLWKHKGILSLETTIEIVQHESKAFENYDELDSYQKIIYVDLIFECVKIFKNLEERYSTLKGLEEFRTDEKNS